MLKIIRFILVVLFLQVSLGFAQEHPGFYVEGRFLYDSCGEKVILRGVANPNIWFQKNGLPQYKEIEKTGANVVRIVWQTNGTAEELDAAIANCIGFEMIPMIECHDATGDWSLLQTVVDYWIRSDIVEVIQNHETYLLLNIANECGDANVSSSAFKTGYESAILQMRTAGIHVPLVIDGTDWGKNINVLQSQGPALIESDPDHNLIFSVHMWWPKMYGYTEQSIVTEIAQSVAMNLPLIVGEFSQMHGSCDETNITASNSIAYLTIIKQCHLNEVGYIAWSWFGNCNPFWDMTTDGTYETLYDWGLEVAVTDSFSIQNTSVRPYSIVYGMCNPNTVEEKTAFAPGGFELMPAYPNPFNGETCIRYRVDHSTHLRLEIYDVLGSRIRTLIDRQESVGEHTVSWNGRDDSGKEAASGTYLVRLTLDAEDVSVSASRKLLLVK